MSAGSRKRKAAVTSDQLSDYTAIKADILHLSDLNIIMVRAGFKDGQWTRETAADKLEERGKLSEDSMEPLLEILDDLKPPPSQLIKRISQYHRNWGNSGEGAAEDYEDERVEAWSSHLSELRAQSEVVVTLHEGEDPGNGIDFENGGQWSPLFSDQFIGKRFILVLYALTPCENPFWLHMSSILLGTNAPDVHVDQVQLAKLTSHLKDPRVTAKWIEDSNGGNNVAIAHHFPHVSDNLSADLIAANDVNHFGPEEMVKLNALVDPGSAGTTSANRRTTFLSLEMEGLGPFSSKTVYYLNHVGLCFVGSDLNSAASNGIGKTSLTVSSLLWCFAEATDRHISGEQANVIASDRRTRVIINGFVECDDGTSFEFRADRQKNPNEPSTFKYYSNSVDAGSTGTDLYLLKLCAREVFGIRIDKKRSVEVQQAIKRFICMTCVWSPFGPSGGGFSTNQEEFDKCVATSLDEQTGLKNARDALERIKKRLKLKTMEAKLQDLLHRTQQKLVGLKSELDKLNCAVEAKEEQESCLQKTRQQLKKLQNRLDHIDSSISEHGIIINNSQKRLMSCSAKLESTSTKVEDLAPFSEIGDSDDRVCPTCGQSVSVSKRAELVASLSDLQRKLRTLEQEKSNIDERIAESRRFVSQCRTEKSDKERALGGLQEKIEAINRDTEDTGDQPAGELYRNSIEALQRIHDHIGELSRMEAGLGREFNAEFIHGLVDDEAIRAVVSEPICKAITDFASDWSTHLTVSKYKRSIEGAIARTGEEVQRLLAKYVTKWFRQMFPKERGREDQIFNAEITCAPRENGSGSDLLFINGDAVSISSLSTGQFCKYKLAKSLAMATFLQVARQHSFNVMILDECFLGLDCLNVADVINTLREFARDSDKSLFISSISRFDTMNVKFDRLIVMRREGEIVKLTRLVGAEVKWIKKRPEIQEHESLVSDTGGSLSIV